MDTLAQTSRSGIVLGYVYALVAHMVAIINSRPLLGRANLVLIAGAMIMTTSLEAQNLAQLQRAVAPLMKLSDEQMLELIPQRAGLRFVGCPNCTAGSQENQLWWTIERPHEVYCRHCDMRYPNDTYPDNQVLRVTNDRGQEHAYPYWDDADGYHHFFQAKGWYVSRLYFEDSALRLAQLYGMTGNEDYGRRAALILRRFAEVYPGYLVHYDYPFRQKILWSGEDDFPYPVTDFRAAKWSWWAYMDISEDLLKAYELLADSDALDGAARQLIEEDLFGGMVEFVYNYPPALTNMDPTLLRALITAGRVLHKPEYMHESVRRIGALVRQQFFADGVWREGAISYHNQTIGGLGILVDLLDGYSDPPDYVPSAGAARFDDLDLGEQLPILHKARQVPQKLRYPNGRVVAFHDTWAREVIAPTQQTQSMLFPELGHAWLGRGVGDGQMQTHLHFSGGYGHQHRDVLALTLFARGQERLGDLGYTHTRHRAWTLTTLSHNTVTVDGQDQHGGSIESPSDGALTLFAPGAEDLLAVVEAKGERAYPGIDTYRRMLVQIGVGDDAYVVDLFRVVGGTRHEYVLAGDADHDGALEHDLPMTAYGPMLLPDGVDVQLPTGESTPGSAGGHNLGYAYLRQVEQAAIAGEWTVTLHSEAPLAGAVRVHGAALGAGDILYSARAPSVRRAQEDDGQLDAFTMPMLVQRRQATQGEALSSTFLTVLEAYGETGPFIDDVQRLDVDVVAGEAVALRVTWGNVVDEILIGSEAGTTVRTGDIELQGRFGFVRRQQGQVRQLWMMAGTSLRVGAQQLRGDGVLRGTVRSTARREAGDGANALDTDLPTASLAGLEGTWAIVIDGAGFHHGHQIEAVESTAAGSVLQLADDPGYVIEATTGRQVYFPGRIWDGETRIEIATSASWSATE